MGLNTVELRCLLTQRLFTARCHVMDDAGCGGEGLIAGGCGARNLGEEFGRRQGAAFLGSKTIFSSVPVAAA